MSRPEHSSVRVHDVSSGYSSNVTSTSKGASSLPHGRFGGAAVGSRVGALVGLLVNLLRVGDIVGGVGSSQESGVPAGRT